jgi:predicted oxidoreductase (fatty acid repression mutant protein)
MSSQNTPINADAVLDLVKARRSHYVLNKDLSTCNPERVQEIVKQALLHIPSSFNSQSNRVVVLFGAEHEKLWDMTTEALKTVVPPENFEPTAQKMALFKGAAGTVSLSLNMVGFHPQYANPVQVLFFEDQEVVEGMQAKFALYADKFPIWATQSDAMLQFTVWTALEAEGLGANLQHYSPIIDSKVEEVYKTPSNWRLNAQLVFGGRTSEAAPKDFMPIEQRFKVFGA